jgi:DHA3 family tetracycline resistance protein-like MFS transporter
VGIGVALSYAGLALAMVVSGLGLVAFAAVLVVVMPERHFRPIPRGERSRRSHALATLREGAGVVRASVALSCFIGVVVFHGMASESFDRLWEVHLLGIGLPAARGLTPVAWFGLLTAGGLLLSIVVGELLRRHLVDSDERTLLRLLILLTALITAGMTAFGLAPGFVAAAAAYWGTLLLRQVVPPLVDAWVNRHIPSDVRATVLSLAGQADAVGQIAGGPLFGWLAGAHGTGLALVAAGLTLLPGIPLLLRARRAGS